MIIVWILNIILFILIIYFGIRLHKKLIIDNNELNEYQSEITVAKQTKEMLAQSIAEQQKLLQASRIEIEEYQNKINDAKTQYNALLKNRTQELDDYANARQRSLDEQYSTLIQEKEESLKAKYENAVVWYKEAENQAKEKAECAERAAEQIINEAYERANQAILGAEEEQNRFNAILEPLRQYEKDRQQRLFYTIQVPEEYKNDIEYLLTSVAAKIQHPDIINKLVWSEYVKPYIDDTFKRVGIKDEPGIYKLTSLIDGKAYIGKSTNIKKRIADHMKSVVGIQTIADQAVHHAIAKDGYWNWTIEPIIYCDKDKLNELEKYYINFFKSQDYGYNKNSGGGG